MKSLSRQGKRLGIYVLLAFIIQTSCLVNESLTAYVPLGGLSPVVASPNLEVLDPRVVKLVRFADVGEQRGYLASKLDNAFVPTATRLELGLQGLKAKGFNERTSAGETACILFGCQFSKELGRMLDSGALAPEEYRAVLGDARDASRGKRFWNCMHQGLH